MDLDLKKLTTAVATAGTQPPTNAQFSQYMDELHAEYAKRYGQLPSDLTDIEFMTRRLRIAVERFDKRTQTKPTTN